MKKYLRVSFLNLLIGVVVLFLIIFVQFRDLSLNVFLLKDLKFLINNKVEDSKYALDSLTLIIRGMRINLSKENPLIIPDSGLYLNPVSYKLQNNEIYVYFENNIFLLFSFDSEDGFSISSNLSRKLILTYAIESGYKIFFDENVLIRGKDYYFKILLGENTQINEREILISPQEIFKIENLIKEIEKPKELILKEESESVSLDINSPDVYGAIKEVEKGIFDSAIVRFQDKAYNAWSSESVFNVNQGGWLKGNVYSFDEGIFVYLLAESLTRPDREDIFLKLESLMNLNEHNLTYLSSSYYVNEEKLDKFFSYLSVNRTFINSLESDKLLGYLKEDSSLLEKIFLSENTFLFNEALNILKKPEVILSFDFNVVQAYNILSNYIVFLKLNNDSFVVGKLKDELANFIANLFLVSGNGRVYIPSDKNKLSWDFEYTLKIAGLLKRLAHAIGDDLVLGLSFNAIYHALMSKEADQIPYEAYYADIVDNDYLPKFTLIPSMGIGNWIYGASKISNYNISDVSYSLDFNRSLNSPGYFFFKGISNPTLVRFRGINWYTDSQFYIYSDGWRYYPSNKMLVLKVTPKKNEDTNILLRFDDIKMVRNIDE
ncbi:hypothetical protein [Borrelia sp. P9F1]|uniref:hypothetical protein n=1 Tax=Borrelia sp. P9F1 TaxID=3058374 RepID=UPI00264861C7|nr:hypothetical protein [Borrelia sp. P9F1]WKC58076.1 hypothetical protein QYZ68_02690 [Borrelia sp. P9F1]